MITLLKNNLFKKYLSIFIAVSILLSASLPMLVSADPTAPDSSLDKTVSGAALDVTTTGGALAIGRLMAFADAVYVSDFEIMHTYGTDVYGGDTWTATASGKGHAYEFNIHYVIAGTGTLPKGALKIKIPEHILRTWNAAEGVYADEITLSVPSEAEAEGNDSVVLVYKSDGNGNIIITNNLPLASGNGGNIELSYTTTESTLEYKDKTNIDTYIGRLTAEISYDSGTTYYKPSEVSENAADVLNVYMDTDVTLSSAKKTLNTPELSYSDITTLYRFENEPTADTADEYYYYVWAIKSNVTNMTQKYNIAIREENFGITSGVQGEIVAIRLAEDSAYRLPTGCVVNSKSNCTKEGERVDWAITRIRKSDLPKDSVFGDTAYTLTNNADVQLTPIFGTVQTKETTADFIYTPPKPPTPNPPAFNTTVEKHGIYNYNKIVQNSSNRSSYDLENLTEDGGTINDLKYMVSSVIYPYEYTIEDTYDKNDIVNNHTYFGKKCVTHTITDDTLTFNDGTTTYSSLTGDDYAFTGLDFSLEASDAVYDSTELTFVKNTATDEFDDDVLDIQLKVGDAYQSAAKYNAKTKTYSDVNSSLITSCSEGSVRINPAANVTGWQIVTKTKHYKSAYVIYPYVQLRASETIKPAVTVLKDNNKTYSSQLNNTVTCQTKDYKENLVNTESQSATDYLSSVTKESSIEKKVNGAEINSTLKRNYTVPWIVTAKETQATESGSVGVEQESGTFYDLLPESGRFDKDSLVVMDSDGTVLKDYQYTYTLTNNYSEGRSLLKIEIDVPSSSGYTIKYNTIHSWADILTIGRYTINHVAYETGNPTIAGGFPDNGGDKNPPVGMIDLDPTTDATKFIYTSQTEYLAALISTLTSIEKLVADTYDSEFSRSTVATPNGEYTYRVVMINDKNTIANNIIIMDSLENYIVNGKNSTRVGEDDNDTSNDKAGTWRGTIVDIDFSRVVKKGANPVVYVTDTAPLFGNYVDDMDTLKAQTADCNWVTLAEYKTAHGSYEGIKGIAVDVTKNTDGDQFELEAGGTLCFDIVMKAPANIDYPENSENNTYNNIWYSAIKHNIGASTNQNECTHQDYTTVTYYTTGNLVLRKMDKATKKPLKDIRFTLTGTSDYGNTVDKALVTNSKGIAYCNDLEKGSYSLEEVYSSDDYQRDTTIRTVTVDKDGNVSMSGLIAGSFEAVDDSDGTNTATYNVYNEPRAHGDLEFYKISRNLKDGNEVYLTGATFTLTGKSDYGNDISLPLAEDAELAVSNSGYVRFNNIEKGTYTLTETAYPTGYAPITTKYTVICDGDGNVSIKELTKDTNGRYKVKNMPYYGFQFTKVDARNTTERLSGAVFKLVLNSLDSSISESGINPDYTYETTRTATSNVNGYFTFAQLVPGTYTLTEELAPSSHSLLENPLTVVINADGEVTVTGTDADKVLIKVLDEQKVLNEHTFEDKITVIKKWVGTVPTFGEAAFPIISVGSDAEAVPDKFVTINKTKFTEYLTAPSHSSCTAFKAALDTDSSHYTDVVNVKDETYDGVYNNGGDFYLGIKDNTIYCWTNAQKVYLPADSSELFKNARNLTSVLFKDTTTGANIPLYADRVTNMSSMFGAVRNNNGAVTDAALINLKTVDFGGNFTNGTNITNISHLFDGCKALTSGECLANLNTSSALTDTSYMFNGCTAVTSIDLRNLVTSNVTTMAYMFNDCQNVVKIITDYTKFTAADKLESVEYMFAKCKKLNGIDLRGFGNCYNLLTIRAWFLQCNHLRYIDLSNFETAPSGEYGKIANIDGLFFATGAENGNNSASNTSKLGCAVFAKSEWKCVKDLKASSLSYTDGNSTVNATTPYDWFRLSAGILDPIQGFNFWNNNDHKTGTEWLKVTTGNYTSEFADGVTKYRLAAGAGYFNQGGEAASQNPNTFYYKYFNGEYAVNPNNKEKTWFAGVNNYFTDGYTVTGDPNGNIKPTVATDTTSTTSQDEDIIEGDSYKTSAVATQVDANTYTVSEYINNEATDYKVTWKLLDAVNGIWSCEIPVYKKTATMYVWEDEYTGYTSDASEDHKKMTDTGVQTIVNKSDSTTDTQEYGSLMLTKQLLLGDKEVINNTEEYGFTITFTDENGVALTGTTYLGTAVLTDGQITARLSGGESFTITEIPAGWRYTIAEGPVGFGCETVTTGITGIITADTTNEETWQNRFINNTNPYSLTVTKAVKQINRTVWLYEEGAPYDETVTMLAAGEDDTAFNYTAVITGLDRGGTYTVKDGDTTTTVNVGTYTLNVDGEKYLDFTANSAGNATVDFSLKVGQTATFVGLPQNSVCTVTENATAGYTPACSVNGGEADVGTSDSALTLSPITMSANATAAFTNTKTVEKSERRTISITVNKNWVRSDGTPITSADAEAADLPTKIDLVVQQFEKIFQYHDTDEDKDVYTLSEKLYKKNVTLYKDEETFTWVGIITDLYKVSKNGNTYIYKIIEPQIAGFVTQNITDGVGGADGSITVTNKKLNTYDFTLAKLVRGNMGNRAQKFSYTLSFTNGTYSVDGIYDLCDGSGSVIGEIVVNNDQTTMTLSSGDAFTIKRLPEGTTVTVKELNVGDYSAAYKIDEGDEAAYTSGDTVSVTLTAADHSITFINTRSAVLPTGIAAHPIAAAAFTALTALMLALFIIIKKRRYA